MKIVNLKEKLYAFVVVLVIIIFGYSLVGIYKDSSAKHIEELESINVIAQAQTLEAKKESDSAKLRAKILEIGIANIQKDMDKQSIFLKSSFEQYTNKLNNLNNFKNEKDYIPNNVNHTTQSDFLTNYKYQPY